MLLGDLVLSGEERRRDGAAAKSRQEREGRGGKGGGERSLQMKQVLWKLLPLHWTSSAWYTIFSQAAHLAPPPQFGILPEGNRLKSEE